MGTLSMHNATAIHDPGVYRKKDQKILLMRQLHNSTKRVGERSLLKVERATRNSTSAQGYPKMRKSYENSR